MKLSMYITFWYSDNPENTFAVTYVASVELGEGYSSSTGFRTWRFDLYLLSDQIPGCSERVSFISI